MENNVRENKFGKNFTTFFLTLCIYLIMCAFFFWWKLQIPYCAPIIIFPKLYVFKQSCFETQHVRIIKFLNDHLHLFIHFVKLDMDLNIFSCFIHTFKGFSSCSIQDFRIFFMFYLGSPIEIKFNSTCFSWNFYDFYEFFHFYSRFSYDFCHFTVMICLSP